MKYFDDMRDKFGFNDGESMPADCWKFREAYVKAINAVAEARGCKQRAFEFDRHGMHNSCLIEFIKADVIDKKDDYRLWEGPGDEMSDILSDLTDVDIDDAVVVTARVDKKELKRLIKAACERTQLVTEGAQQ